MKIANPIYDVVFKYLMSDMRIARFIISKIIGEEIESVEVKPTEFSTKIENDVRNFTVFHLDFAATIVKPDGTREQVLIELQKAKLPTDIMRFRRYLGTQYQSKDNFYTFDNKGNTRAYPIKTIYFLGHKLDNVTAPVVKVERSYFDAYSGEKLVAKEEFIESLTHDSFIIQIPFLHEKRQNKLSLMLSLFDQSQKDPNDKHFLEITEDNYPPEFEFLVRKLREAAMESEVVKVMQVEDELINEFSNLERMIDSKNEAIAEKDQALEEKSQALEEKSQALEEKSQALEEKSQALEKNARTLEENAKALEENDRILAEQKKALESNKKALSLAIAALMSLGKTEEEARATLGM